MKKKCRMDRLVCPVCGFKRLLDVVPGVETEVFAAKDIPEGWIPDIFIKCPNCKAEIGIKKK